VTRVRMRSGIRGKRRAGQKDQLRARCPEKRSDHPSRERASRVNRRRRVAVRAEEAPSNPRRPRALGTGRWVRSPRMQCSDGLVAPSHFDIQPPATGTRSRTAGDGRPTRQPTSVGVGFSRTGSRPAPVSLAPVYAMSGKECRSFPALAGVRSVLSTSRDGLPLGVVQPPGKKEPARANPTGFALAGSLVARSPVLTGISVA